MDEQKLDGNLFAHSSSSGHPPFYIDKKFQPTKGVDPFHIPKECEESQTLRRLPVKLRISVMNTGERKTPLDSRPFEKTHNA